MATCPATFASQGPLTADELVRATDAIQSVPDPTNTSWVFFDGTAEELILRGLAHGQILCLAHDRDDPYQALHFLGDSQDMADSILEEGLEFYGFASPRDGNRPTWYRIGQGSKQNGREIDGYDPREPEDEGVCLFVIYGLSRTGVEKVLRNENEEALLRKASRAAGRDFRTLDDLVTAVHAACQAMPTWAL